MATYVGVADHTDGITIPLPMGDYHRPGVYALFLSTVSVTRLYLRKESLGRELSAEGLRVGLLYLVYLLVEVEAPTLSSVISLDIVSSSAWR